MILRFIFSFFGGIFSMLTLGAGMAALSLGRDFLYVSTARTCPSYETLANYQPKTINRVCWRGQVIDEVAEKNAVCSHPQKKFPFC
jgi:penicillin-binding protein 1A